MNIKSPGIFLFCAVSLSLSFLAGCSPVVTVGTVTPITPTPSLTPITETPVCPSGNCPSDSLTVTAVTVVSLPGDLGWGKVHGKIVDGNTSLPIEGALVKCEHSSYSSPYRCNGTAPTNAEGFYTFDPVFFHDTDRIILTVEAPGYASLRFEKAFFTQPDFHRGPEPVPVNGQYTNLYSLPDVYRTGLPRRRPRLRQIGWVPWWLRYDLPDRHNNINAVVVVVPFKTPLGKPGRLLALSLQILEMTTAML